MDQRKDNPRSTSKLDETLTIHQMLKDVQRRRMEGWRFNYGVDGYQYAPAGKTETIRNNYMNKFSNDQEALEWVKKQAAKGSIYHQRAIEYVIVAQMSPQTVVKDRFFS